MRKDFLSIHDFSAKEVAEIMTLAKRLKQEQKSGIAHPILKDRTLGMIFRKSSTRTRVSFQVGMWQLGGTALYLNSNDLQIGRGEPVRDTARVLSRYLDGIMIRTFSHQEVEELAEYASIPVINGLTDLVHPCQALADIFTAMEYLGDLKGKRLAYVGDGNNMAHALMHACAKVGMDVAIASPPGYKPNPVIVAEAEEDAKAYGSAVEIVDDPFAAVHGADVLYTDVWASMGQEAEQEIRKKAFAGYCIDADLLKAANPGAVVMHCLPAHRGEEITDEVMEGPQSVVFDEAENRLHVQKAIMALVMGNHNK